MSGSAVAPGDFRLRKLVEPLQQAAQKAPVFGRVAQAVQAVLDSNERKASVALLELTTLVNAILYTQGETGVAGETVAQRWTRGATQRILRSRELGTRNLVRGIEALPADQRPGVLVSGSASGYYGDRSDELLDETAVPNDDFLSDVCQRWGHEAVRAEALGLRVVRVRTGIVLSADFGALPPQLKVARFGVLGTLGTGKQWVPWIHVDDEVGLLLHALDHPDAAGPINAAAPGIVRQKAFAKAVAHAVHRPAFTFAPRFAVRTLAGHASALVLASQRMTPTAAEQYGYSFEFAGLTSALDDLVQ